MSKEVLAHKSDRSNAQTEDIVQKPKPSDLAEAGRFDRSIAIHRDAIGNVIVSGDNNTVPVTLIVSDSRLSSDSISKTIKRTENPYQGLAAFYEDSTQWFFGRQSLIRQSWLAFQSLQRGNSCRILPIIGTSGSGKSSLVRAGLLPEIAREKFDNFSGTKVLILRPGARPVQELSNVLERFTGVEGSFVERLGRENAFGAYASLHSTISSISTSEHERFIIFVDQFEELFTECSNPDERNVFVENLTYAASKSDRKISVIFTIRSDFSGAVKSPQSLYEAVRGNKIYIKSMTRDELIEVISKPAQLLGNEWPKTFVDYFVSQVEGRAGALPLLQFALKRLWADRERSSIDDTDWNSRIIDDFLVETAEYLYDLPNPPTESRIDYQSLVKNAFIAMVQLGDGVPDTRRVARLSEFVADGDDPELVRLALKPFTAPETRLITVSDQLGGPTYELSHEALLSSWDRLRSWLGYVTDRKEAEEIRRQLKNRRKLSSAAWDWQASAGDLLRKNEIKECRMLAKTSLEKRYIRASANRIFLQNCLTLAPLMLLFLILMIVAGSYAKAKYIELRSSECDLTAAERDNNVGVSGVEFDRIITEKSIPACETAVAAMPDNPRYLHNLARSYDRASEYDRAAEFYKRAAKLNWPSSQNNLAVLYIYGRGVDIDLAKAVDLFKLAEGNITREGGSEEAAQRATKNYKSTDFSVLFEGDSDAVSILADSLRDRNLLNPSKDVSKYDENIVMALEKFKEQSLISEKGVSLRVLDKLGIITRLSDHFARIRQSGGEEIGK